MARKKTKVIEYIIDQERLKDIKYDNFLKQANYLENNKKCKYCKTKSLVHCNFEEHYLLCSKCGITFKYNEKTKRLVTC